MVESHEMSPSRARRTAAIVVVGLVAGLLVAVSPTPLTPAPSAAAASKVIDLQADTVQTVAGDQIDPGDDVQWRNRSGRTLEITSASGLLESGPIPDGGSFYVSLPVPGIYEWSSDVGGGTLIVVSDLVGDDDLARSSIPDLAPPPRDPSDEAIHPDLGTTVPRSTILVTFAADATVEEARDAIAPWDVVGGLADFGIVYLRRSTPASSFAVTQAKLDDLRSDPAIENAAYHFALDIATLPPPTDLDGWEWDSIAVSPLGDRANWAWENARVPAAWNLLDALRDRGAFGRNTTVIFDKGFEAHADLDRVELGRICAPSVQSLLGIYDGQCTSTVAGDHGNHVAGIVGADFDDVGIAGVDPLSDLYAVSADMEQQGDIDRRFNEYENGALSLHLLFREMAAGRVPSVGVINMSIQLTVEPEDWWPEHQDDRCGPGLDDDGGGSTGVCYPDTDDDNLREQAENAALYRTIIEEFVEQFGDDTPLFVHSTGNLSNDFCASKVLDCPTDEAVTQSGDRIHPIGWASANWQLDPELNPILSVESLGNVRDSALAEGTVRSDFSNVGGDISAVGYSVSAQSSAFDATKDDSGCDVRTGGANGYCLQSGTSQASPIVAGVAGLVKGWEPTLTAPEIKQHLIDWAVTDTTPTGVVAPRVDAYRSLLSLDGAAAALVDVNDPSVDGNRRVVYDSDGTIDRLDTDVSLQSGSSSQADGVVDLRDFRRFRDAWLLRCTIDQETGCPDPADIALDGGVDHPKRDLNLDGAVELSPPTTEQSPASELTGSRFDFNGDGTISRSQTSLVPITDDGDPVTDPGAAGPMTDLDVLRALWGTAPGGAIADVAGVAAGDLDQLLVSGDVTFDFEALATNGATSVFVTATDHTTGDPVRAVSFDLTGVADEAVMTLPTGTYRFETLAVGLTCNTVVGPLALAPGQDRTIDPTVAVAVSVPPRSDFDRVLTAGVSVESCGGPVEGASVDVTVEPELAGGLTVDGGRPAATVNVDASGAGTVTVESGSLRGAYDIVATAELPRLGGGTATVGASAEIAVGDSYDLEFAAITGTAGQPSDYDAVDEFLDPGRPLGPSVNWTGRVAFGGLADADDRYRVYVAEPGDAPTVASEADTPGASAIPADALVIGDPKLNETNDVAFAFEVRDTTSSDIATTIVRDALATEVLATATATFGTTDAPLQRVADPTINASGRTIFRATDQADSTTLAELSGDTVVRGLTTPAARPALADDGTTVVRSSIVRSCNSFPGVCGPGTTQIIDPIILVGDGVQAAARSVIAEGRVDGWGALSDADIAASGEVIVFIGDRSGERSLYVSLRRPHGTWIPPTAVAGPDDLGALDLDGPSVAQVAAGADGLAGDRLLITVRSTGGGQNEIRMVPVTVAPSDVPDTPFVPVGDTPVPVAEVGDSIEIADRAGPTFDTLTRIELGDSIARAAVPEFDDDHWVAFYAETASGRQGYVRARALPPATGAPTVVVGSGPGSVVTLLGAPHDPTPSTTGRTSTGEAPTGTTSAVRTAASPVPSAVALPAQATAPEEPEVLDGPHVTAITVADDTPVARVPVTVTNRSRTLDGTAAFAVLDETSGFEIFPTPVLLGPDESTDISFPDQGLDTFTIASPVTAGDGRNLLRVEAVVAQGQNRPPEVTIDGPFTIAPGQQLIVRPTATDPDGLLGQGRWDLDNDGAFDDDSFTTLILDGDEVQAQICSGTCVLDQPYPIAVQVTDREGETATATTTVTLSEFDGEFALRLEPALIQVNTGRSGVSYAVIDGPDRLPPDAEITFEDVPAGWSVSASSVVGRSTQINVNVPNSAAEDTFDITVVASLGDVERRATLTVVTVFSLIPECSTTITGTVRDGDGRSIEGAIVSIVGIAAGNAVSTADGSFTIPGRSSMPLPILSQGFTSQRFTWTATGPSGGPLYLSDEGGPAFAECDGTTTISPVLEELAADASLTARAVIGIPNPVNPSRPIPTDTPLSPATISANSRPDTVTETLTIPVGPDGRATFTDIPTQTTSGADLEYDLDASAAGYWGTSRSITLDDTSSTFDAGDLPLIARCTATVTGGRVIDQFGDPVEGAVVKIRFDDQETTSEPDGSFQLDREQSLGEFNQARSVQVEAEATFGALGSDKSSAFARLDECGAQSAPVTIQLDRPEPPPVQVTAGVSGTVVDAVTGDPVPFGTVNILINGSFRTNPSVRENGTFGPTSFVIGTTATPNPSVAVTVEAAPFGYEPGEVSDTLTEAGLDLRIEVQPIQTVGLSGSVTDIETGAPVEAARVTASFGQNQRVFTPADGTYSFDAIRLGSGNAPVAGDVFVDFDDPQSPAYWPTSVPATLIGDADNVVDLQVIPICDGVDVSGTVFNAADLTPLDGVTVRVGSLTTITGVDGRYELIGVPVDADNAPATRLLQASKVGFFSSSIGITSFCNGEITVDFGRPPAGTGSVTGTVTDDTGAAIVGATIATGWGASTTTSATGTYSLDDAPLGDAGAARDWVITAINGLDDLSRTVTVDADTPAVADFIFGDVPPPPDDPDAIVDFPGSIAEGDSVTFDATGSTGSGALVFEWTLLGSDGATIATGSGPTWTYQFDDDFVGVIRVVVSDDQGGSTTIDEPVVVDNVAPDVKIDEAQVSPEPATLVGSASAALTTATVELGASFTDPGPADTHTVTIDWGDGTSETVGQRDGSIAASRPYTIGGPVTIVVEVCDDDGGCSDAERLVELPEITDTQNPTTTTTTPTTDPTPTTPSPTVAPGPATNPQSPSAPPAPTTTPPPGGDPNTRLPATGGSSPSNALTLAVAALALGLGLFGLGSRRSRPRRSANH